MMAQPATAKQLGDRKAVRIAPGRRNNLARMLDLLVGDVSFTLVADKLHYPTRMTPNQGVAEPIRAGVPAKLTGDDRAMIAGARSC